MKITNKFSICMVLCIILTIVLAIAAVAYVDKNSGQVGGSYCDGMIYKGTSGGYRSSTYVSTAGSNVDTIWAKVELIVSGNHPTKQKYGSSNSVDTDECTSTSYIASVRGYHYIELITGDTWGSYSSAYTSYITP